MTICDTSHVTPPAITGGDISMDISFCSSGGIFSLLTALFLLVVKKARPSDTLPFAPFLAAGAVLSGVLELIMETG